ncbi:hypothetical protein ACEN30_00505 [Marinilactibacillus psychrotolerans]|uniref:hypothetical protein n=1 Tax=Marinilactibacillus psychrotolerans TaxID=191770 RepID=UPI00388B14CC
MNAQEAIEIIENQITEIEELIYDRVNLEEGGYISFNQRIVEQKELTDLKEALSIVLESAKKLQEIKDKALSYAFIKDIDCSNVELYDFAKWVYDKAEGFEVEK